MFVAIIAGQLFLYTWSTKTVLEKWGVSVGETIDEVEKLEESINNAIENNEDDSFGGFEGTDNSDNDWSYSDSELFGELIKAEFYSPEALQESGLVVSINRASFDHEMGITLEFLVTNNSDTTYTFTMDGLTLDHAFLNQSMMISDIEPGFSGIVTKYISGRAFNDYSFLYDSISKIDGTSYLYNSNTGDYIFNMDESANFSIVFDDASEDVWLDIPYYDGTSISYGDISITADTYVDDGYGEAYRFIVNNYSMEAGNCLLVKAAEIKVNGEKVDGYCSVNTIPNSYGYAYLSLYDDISLRDSEISVVFNILDLSTYDLIGTTEEMIIHT